MTTPEQQKLKAIETVLSTHLGPIGPITLDTQIRNLGLDREQVAPEHIQVLVSQIGEAVSSLIGEVKGKIIREKLQEAVGG